MVTLREPITWVPLLVLARLLLAVAVAPWGAEATTEKVPLTGPAAPALSVHRANHCQQAPCQPPQLLLLPEGWVSCHGSARE